MNKIFVICPYLIDPDFLKKKEIAEGLCKVNGYELFLAEDEVSHKSLDAEKTIKLFDTINYFIADLSFERPSCYFEVGFLQSRGANISLIAMKGTLVHQILGKEKLRIYNDLESYGKTIETILESWRVVSS